MRLLLLMLTALLFVGPALSAEHRILMLNYGKDGSMVFEPGFLKAELGDTITFVPENSSHYVQSYAVPDGAAPWRSELDKPFTVTVDREGVFLYYCPPHLMISMIGVVQVGTAINLEAVTEKSAKLRSWLAMKNERLDNYLSRIVK